MSTNHWNYRAIKTPDGWGVFEVYYTDWKPIALTKDPMCGYYEELSELVEDLTNMLNDVTQRVPMKYSEEDGFESFDTL